MPPTDHKQYYIEHKEIIITRSKNRYLENKEKCLEYQHKRYSENKEEILNRQKIKTKCECGSLFNRSRKKRHVQTNKHIKYLQSLASQSGLVLVCDVDNVE